MGTDWSTAWAPRHEDINQCVACGLCLPFCPTFRLTGDEAASPRGRLAAMAAVADSRVPIDGRFAEIMEFCLQCRACEAVCPSLVPFGRAMDGARAEIAAHHPAGASTARRWAFGTAIDRDGWVKAATVGAAVAQRMGVAARIGPARGLRRIRPHSGSRGRSWDPEGSPRGTVALFTGCVMDAWFPEVHAAVIGVLRMAGYRVEAPAAQGCCGALAAHEGAASAAERMAETNVAAFTGYESVVVDAAGCGAHLAASGHWSAGGDDLAARVVDATVLVARLIDRGLVPASDGDHGPIAVQDPCHLRHAQGIVAEPREILAAAGYLPVDIDPLGLCCGAAGSYSLSHPEASAELGARKAAEIAASGARVVATANPGCDMQLRRFVAAGVRVAHPVELYWEVAASAHSSTA